MNVILQPSALFGSVEAPPSKSMAHRLLIGAGLATGESVIDGVSDSADVQTTCDLLRALGARVEQAGERVSLSGMDPRRACPDVPLDCRECGSTLRFFIPICLLSGHPVTLTGAPRLMERPLGVYEALCREKGYLWKQTKESLTVKGPLEGGEFTLPGDVSSQFISGLLLALPLCERDSVLHILPPMESRPYVDMTVAALKTFGVRIEQPEPLTYHIPGGQHYRAERVQVEGDYSNAAFFDALAYLGHRVTVTGLDPHSLQGDKIYLDYFQQLSRGTPTLSLAQCPDLGPVLMSLAAALNGATFTHTRRLAVKESDRGRAMAEELAKLGVRVEREEDRITVYPGLRPPLSPLSGQNDHRIVMALALLLTRCGGEIQGAQAVEKSLPAFFTMLEALGAKWKQYETDQR